MTDGPYRTPPRSEAKRESFWLRIGGAAGLLALGFCLGALVTKGAAFYLAVAVTLAVLVWHIRRWSRWMSHGDPRMWRERAERAERRLSGTRRQVDALRAQLKEHELKEQRREAMRRLGKKPAEADAIAEAFAADVARVASDLGAAGLAAVGAGVATYTVMKTVVESGPKLKTSSKRVRRGRLVRRKKDLDDRVEGLRRRAERRKRR